MFDCEYTINYGDYVLTFRNTELVKAFYSQVDGHSEPVHSFDSASFRSEGDSLHRIDVKYRSISEDEGRVSIYIDGESIARKTLNVTETCNGPMYRDDDNDY